MESVPLFQKRWSGDLKRENKEIYIKTRTLIWETLSPRKGYCEGHYSHSPKQCLKERVKPNITECGPLEKGIANHFSILALRTP